VAIVSAIIAINFLLAPLLRHQLSSGSFSALFAGLTMMHGVMLTAMFAILWKKRVGLRSAFGGGSHRFMDDVRTGGAGFLSMIVAVVPAMILTGLILKAMNRDGEPQEIISLFAMQDGVFKRVFIAGWAVLIAPIAEEMLFRGILLPLALRRFTPVPAVLLVSVFFAFIHQSETAFLPLIAVSASLCLAFMATESIVVSITMHALFNALTTSFVLMSG
jgi:membrane protease YdiL (CAAX protease family)